MARGVNKAIILGTAGSDPEVRYTAGGSAITTVSLATNESWNDKQTGEKKERTEWHRVKFFGKLAEIVGEYVKKGKQLYVEGSLRTDKYTDKEGVERYTTYIVANEMQLLGGRESRSEEADSPREGQRPRRQAGASGEAPARTGPSAEETGQPTREGTFEDDDIPF